MNVVDITQLDGILNTHLRQLMRQTLYLLEREVRQPKKDQVADYGFLVFTGAIVYEGFLKRLFYTLGLISAAQLNSDPFRIGKALNPDLPDRYRDEGYVYEAMESLCGMGVAHQLWQAWKKGRNHIFHYDFMGKQNVTLAEAEETIMMLLEAMLAAAACERNTKREKE